MNETLPPLVRFISIEETCMEKASIQWAGASPKLSCTTLCGTVVVSEPEELLPPQETSVAIRAAALKTAAIVRGRSDLKERP
jgi:hypothetical protein